MNKKFTLLLVLLLFCKILEGQEVFYINPDESLPFKLCRNADTDNYNYGFYIQNKKKINIYGSPNKIKEPKKNPIEHFFSSVEEYQKPEQIEISWNYKRDDKQNDTVLDDEYTIFVIEIDKKNKNKKNIYDYKIILDRKSPSISNKDCCLSKSLVYRNKREDFTLKLNSKEKASYWKVSLDNSKVLYESPYQAGNETLFPPNILIEYETYSKLNIGEHRINVLAKDSAGNKTEVYTTFKLERYPYDFSIFSNEGLIYKLNGETVPFKYTGLGYMSSLWKTIIYDANGTELFSDIYQPDTDSYCKSFVWRGISEQSNKKVSDGKYFVEISCKDTDGKEIKKTESFSVTSEKKYLPDESMVFLGKFLNEKFILSLNDYTEEIKNAILNVKKDETLLYREEIQNIENIFWNGYDLNDNYCLSTGERYDFDLDVIYFSGKTNRFSTTVNAGLIYCDEIEERKKINIKPIYFEANETELLSYNQYFNQNADNLKKLSESLISYISPDELIILEGNANYTTYPNTNFMLQEKNELEQLSRQRAEIVKCALVFYGIPAEQILIKANGGDNYIVEPNDEDNWKNRRVEIFIEKVE